MICFQGSGTRLWTFIEDQFKTADNFFEKSFIYNYCPLIYMSESGKNYCYSHVVLGGVGYMFLWTLYIRA